MILSERGKVKIQGRGPIVLAELEDIFRALLEDDHVDEELILKVLKNAQEDEDDIPKVSPRLKRMIDELVDAIGEELDEDE